MHAWPHVQIILQGKKMDSQLDSESTFIIRYTPKSYKKVKSQAPWIVPNTKSWPLFFTTTKSVCKIGF